MLKRHAAFFCMLCSVIDIIIISGAWILVYWVRFCTGFFSVSKGIPDFGLHLMLTLPVAGICYMSCVWVGLYKPKRVQTLLTQSIGILKAAALSILLILAIFYYIQNEPYSRKLLPLFGGLLFVGLACSHLWTIAVLRYFRKKGYNLRHYAVIGTGKKGQQLVRDIEQANWLGLKCEFFIDHNSENVGSTIAGVPVRGTIEQLPELIKGGIIDEVYLTLEGIEAQKAYPILETLQCTGITIRIIPDWGNLIATSNATTVEIGSQVLFSASDSPLSGTNIMIKEIFDYCMALLLLTVLAVPMAIVAMIIKLSSKGPVFYKQMRIGMDQKEFKIIKFRTMVVNAEEENHWTQQNDPRVTPIGAWLRRTSLDELPQLLNVLKGQMSLVGPRPERPHFAKQFSEDYKRYMLRHKVKAGMTGWAQIHDFRGDTSLRKRLQYDLYYIRNWSLGLDFRILLLTPWHIIRGKNAY
jgi:Undecaprenyl-phosphate glucose phosphotransferase